MKIAKHLLIWYDRNSRSLPWRGSQDPYRIWLSEIMLQQTRSETVIRYYDRFLSHYPDIFSLAAAPIDDILKLWEGLGYYSRAKNLHACAQVIASRGGQFPTTVCELEKLPGIGPYVSRAVASIAFNEPVPALDGNQMRVYSRVYAVDQILKTPFDLEEQALKEMSQDRPGDYNQALMDLGASICTPRNPQCAICPLVDLCKAHTEGEPECYPMRPTPILKKNIDLTILLIRTAGGICVRKRTQKLLGGLYEFPTIEDHIDESTLHTVLAEMGCGDVFSVTQLPKAKHIFTHLIWNMNGYLIDSSMPADDCEVVSGDEISQLAFPSALRVYREIALDNMES